MSEQEETFTSAIWSERAEADDPFTAAECRCAGYDVFGDLLGQVEWIEYLFLLFRKEPPSQPQKRLLNDLAVALAAQGPRDLATQAATSAAAGGSPMAACLMAALSVGAGQHGGAREVYHAVLCWESFAQDTKQWQRYLSQSWPLPDPSTWPDREHPAGFDPNGLACSRPTLQTLSRLASHPATPHLNWLRDKRPALETAASMPLALSGVAASAFFDLGFDAQQAEMLYLLLRLPGAAAFALEQHVEGWSSYPFHSEGLHLLNDPGN
ncbi:citrate synthase [Alteromonadaceae bacterium Bs31]|nr:citrate synthase [Alteromonadaceae bacterium Bs31]